MKNFFYYLKHYGDVDFVQRPFCEVDAMLLSHVVYLGFDEYLQIDGAPERLADLDTEEILNTLCATVPTPKRDRKLWLAMTKSKRYRDCKLFCHVDDVDVDEEGQFAAVTFLFDGFSVVTYRGTDLTLLGWKEDFNMSYLTEIPSQRRAVRYLKYVASLTDGTLYVCGHSKGGNLAIYAAVKNLDDYGDRIRGVYNFDGPGFPYDIANDPDYREHASKFHKYVPFGSTIGTLLYHTTDMHIVKSRGFGIEQHLLYNWKFEGDGYLSYAKKFALGVPLYEEIIKEWATRLSTDEVKVFVDATFDVLGAKDGVTLVDYFQKPKATWLGVWRRSKLISRETRRLMFKTFRQFIHAIRVSERRIRHRNRDIRRKARETRKLMFDLNRKKNQ